LRTSIGPAAASPSGAPDQHAVGADHRGGEVVVRVEVERHDIAARQIVRTVPFSSSVGG
jgi:hypothetical protein